MEGGGGDEVPGRNEVRLRHALDPRTRRWARAEFFCSALDRPWLANDGVQELCNHFGLKQGQLARLTRTEWTCIRKSIGRPRRLSLAFLRQVGQPHPPFLLHPWNRVTVQLITVTAASNRILPVQVTCMTWDGNGCGRCQIC